MANATLEAEVRTEPKPGFFQQEWPANLILGSFFFVTIPMALFVGYFGLSNLLVVLYVWLFGMTHFMLTLTIYLNRANLNYFNQTWSNRLVYFIVPVSVFLVFDLIHATDAQERLPLLVIGLFIGVRLLDFNHFGRQSFGVLMMFKTRDGISYPSQLKRFEAVYFNLLTLLLFVTYLSGGLIPLLQAGGPLTLREFDPPEGGRVALPIPVLQIASLVLLVAVGATYVCLVAKHRQARQAGQFEGESKPVRYLTFQTLGALLAVVSLPLYLATLALHYVEYHVLMVPRCLHLPLDETSRVDRIFLWMRSSAFKFYAILLAVAALATICLATGMGAMGVTKVEPGALFSYLALIALFDGLFVFHYFVETFIWRFSNPYYRNQLASLYFAPKPAPARG